MAVSKRNLRHIVAKEYQIEYYEGKNFRSVKPHTHRDYEIYLYFEGDTLMELDGVCTRLNPGDIVIIPPGVVHLAKVNPDIYYRRFDFWLPTDFITMLPEKLRRVISEAVNGKYIYNLDIVSANIIGSKLFALIEEERTTRYAKEEQIRLMYSELLLYLNRILIENERKNAGHENASVFALICDYIDGHLMGDLSLDRLAKEFFVSKSYLSHLFQEYAGISVHRFIQIKRLAFCRDAIQSGMSITNVYNLSGVKDYSSFYRAFKKEYGVSPSEFERGVHKNKAQI